MSRKLMTALLSLLCLLAALNLSGLVLNLSVPARAAIAGMSYQELVRDQISRVRSSRLFRNAKLMLTSPS